MTGASISLNSKLLGGGIPVNFLTHIHAHPHAHPHAHLNIPKGWGTLFPGRIHELSVAGILPSSGWRDGDSPVGLVPLTIPTPLGS